MSDSFIKLNMKIIFVTAIIIFLIFSVAAQQPDLSSLSKTRNGQRVLAYFTAFNSGDEQKLRDFFTENIADESLKQRGVEPRMKVQQQIRGDLQTVEIKKVSLVSES